MINFKKLLIGTAAGVIMFGSLAASAFAATPNWNLTGSYVIDYMWNGGDYLNDVTLVQTGGTFTGTMAYPSGGSPTVHGIVNGTVSGDTVTFTVQYDDRSYLRSDTGTVNSASDISGTWSDANPSANNNGNWRITSGIATPFLIGPPTNMDQCKKDGWKTFNNPTFKNQGTCVSYVQANEHAGKRLGAFTATDSLYYNCATACGSIYGTGPINFTWDTVTGNVTGGSYNEVVAGTTYYNVITSATVIGGVVNLTFDRITPNVNHFTFTGTLIGNVLSGLLDGPYYFTATGI